MELFTTPDAAYFSVAITETTARNDINTDKNKVSSIRSPMLIQGRLERSETNLTHFKWEMT